MAYVPNRDDPHVADPMSETERNQRLERELQVDPELAEGPASSGRVAMYAIAILAVLGALFYGLNAANNSSQTASNPANPPSTMAQGAPADRAAPGAPVRNVTPGPNSGAGATTGSAPSGGTSQ